MSSGSDRDKSVELVYGGAAAADQPTESDVGDIVARAKAALEGITPGPWESGDRYHVQAADRCPCREEQGPLVGVDPAGAYGAMHVHRRPEPLWPDGIRTRDDSTGGVDVVVETDEYGLMRPEDREFIAQSPELVAELVAEVERLATTVERVWGLAVKMKGEHGQSWNTISGQRILAALDDAWDSGSGDPS